MCAPKFSFEAKSITNHRLSASFSSFTFVSLNLDLSKTVGNRCQNFWYTPPPLFCGKSDGGGSVETWGRWCGMDTNMGRFEWNSMFKAAGLRLQARGGPGWVGSRPWARSIPQAPAVANPRQLLSPLHPWRSQI